MHKHELWVKMEWYWRTYAVPSANFVFVPKILRISNSNRHNQWINLESARILLINSARFPIEMSANELSLIVLSWCRKATGSQQVAEQ